MQGRARILVAWGIVHGFIMHVIGAGRPAEVNQHMSEEFQKMRAFFDTESW